MAEDAKKIESLAAAALGGNLILNTISYPDLVSVIAYLTGQHALQKAEFEATPKDLSQNAVGTDDPDELFQPKIDTLVAEREKRERENPKLKLGGRRRKTRRRKTSRHRRKHRKTLRRK